MRTHWKVWLALGTLLAAAGLVGIFAPVAPAAASPPPMRFGMDLNSATQQAGLGVKPDYGVLWVGPWTLKHGWGGPDGSFDKAVAEGVTPVVQYYYWGDDISPSCLENGCWSDLHQAQKDRTSWNRLATELADHLRARLAGRPVVIILETEFNKGGAETYEPLDGWLAEKANYFHTQVPGSIVVLGFGNWGSDKWSTFDRAAAAADLTGLQGMRGSTRNSLTEYKALVDALLSGVQRLGGLFARPVFITDIAASSYPEPDWLEPQAGVIDALFDRLAEFKAAGVQGLMYRTLRDNPNMDTANYFGEAERHWGFLRSDASQKPAWTRWRDGVLAERASSVPSRPIVVPVLGVVLEAESLAVKTTGISESDTGASGGQRWNLWANGQAAHDVAFQAPGTYDVVVRARGQPMAGVAPHMEVRIGSDLLLSADPDAAAWTDYAESLHVADAETRRLSIAFTNDGRSSTEDRNLLLDRVEVRWRAADNRPPEAIFAWMAQGLRVVADAAGSKDADGDALRFLWSWGDGAASEGATASHTYAASGNYTVTLVAHDGRLGGVRTESVTAQSIKRAIEVETFVSKSAGRQESDSTASAAKRWNLWSNGYVSHSFDLPTAGQYQLRVRATGTALAGVAPHMDVRVGDAVVLRADPATGGWRDYLATVTVSKAGSHTVRLDFTNDATSRTEDRNLLLDKVELEWQSP